MCDCFKGRSAASSDIDKALQKAKKDAQYNIRLLLLGKRKYMAFKKVNLSARVKLNYFNFFRCRDIDNLLFAY